MADMNRDTTNRTNAANTGTGASASASTTNTTGANAPDSNRDPITGTPGAHPVGTGVGAAGGGAAGAAAGAAIGSVVPGLGTVVGGVVGTVVGAVAGGLAGKGVAEAVNPTAEDAYWREQHKTRPYATEGDYDDYRPAYQYGWESRTRHQGKRYEEVESDLERGWDSAKGQSKLGWEKAKHATREAWHKVERAIPGDADRDGR